MMKFKLNWYRGRRKVTYHNHKVVVSKYYLKKTTWKEAYHQKLHGKPRRKNDFKLHWIFCYNKNSVSQAFMSKQFHNGMRFPWNGQESLSTFFLRFNFRFRSYFIVSLSNMLISDSLCWNEEGADTKGSEYDKWKSLFPASYRHPYRLAILFLAFVALFFSRICWAVIRWFSGFDVGLIDKLPTPDISTFMLVCDPTGPT